MNKTYTIIFATVILMFGLLTLFLTSSIIFDWFEIREKEGNYVSFIVWVNFICAWLYLLSSFGILKRKRWPLRLLFIAAMILVVALIGFFFYINAGLEYETKTIGAMIFRILVTLLFVYIVRRKIPN